MGDDELYEEERRTTI